MRKMKRLMAMLLAGMLLMAGCSGESGESSLSSAGETQSSQVSQASGSSAESTEVNPADAPTLKWLSYYASFDPNSEYAAGLLEELTRYKVEYHLLPSENAEQRLSLEISSGNHYDVMKLTYTQYAMLAGQGALLPLNSYLDENPGIQANTDPKGWYTVTQQSGDILGVPEVGLVQLSNALGFRKDLFDQYGWELPNTVDEFYQLLVDIKTETGKIPLTGNQAIQPTVFSGFGLDTYAFEINDGKVQSYLRNPGVREYLTFMNKLYNEGLIDPDWPVNKGENVDQKMSTGDAVMTNMSWSSTPNWTRALQETVPEASFESILPLTDSNSVKHINPNSGTAIGSVMCIPKGAEENAPYVMDMIEKRLEKDVYWQFNAGTEGVHYNLEDGVPVPIQPKYAEDMTNGNYFQTSVNYFEHPITWMSRVAKDELLYDAWYDMNLKSLDYDYIYDPFFFSNFEEYEKYNASLSQKANDYFMQVIAGTESIDSYDSFLESWEQAGGLEYEAGAQEWYDSNPEIIELALASEPAYKSVFGK